MRTRLLLNQHGMSLISVLFTIVIFTIAMSSMLALAKQKRTLAQQMNVSVAADIVKQKLIGMVLAPQSWQATQARNSNAFANFQDGRLPLLDIYSSDSNTAYYRSTDKKAGFDLKGKTCLGFSEKGNDLCPLRYEISLKNRTFQNGNWIDTLHFELSFKSSTSMILNTTTSEYTFDIVRNINDRSVESACISVRGVYDAKENSCSLKLTKFVPRCLDHQTYRGPAQNGGASYCDEKKIASMNCTGTNVIKGFDNDGRPVCGAPL